MICPKCSGDWIVKETRKFFWQKSVPRHVCKECGYLDTRKTWVNDVYVGPPGLETDEDHERHRINNIFFKEGMMPCCGNEISFFEGPSGGCCTNIKCAHCGSKWNMSSMTGTIERI